MGETGILHPADRIERTPAGNISVVFPLDRRLMQAAPEGVTVSVESPI